LEGSLCIGIDKNEKGCNECPEPTLLLDLTDEKKLGPCLSIFILLLSMVLDQLVSKFDFAHSESRLTCISIDPQFEIEFGNPKLQIKF
jgi:hypothetical protein